MKHLRKLPLSPGWVWLPLALLFALLLAMPSTSLAKRAPYDQGQKVKVTGLVSDRDGQPLSGIRVTLESSRSYFSMRDLRRAEKDVRRVSVLTDARGEYTLEWPWDSYFNRFELVAGVPVRKGQEDRMEALERVDVTQRVLAGSPAIVTVTVKNAAFLQKLREFVESVRSEDERRVYGEMGKPDEVKNVQSDAGTESTWWYFDHGRAYRFRNGRLEQVIPFDPVKRF